MEFVVVMTMCPDVEVGRRIAKALVSSRLAACVNVIDGATSFYRWKGKLQEDIEVLLLAKTRAEMATEVQRVIAENHPYELPEAISLPIVGGSEDYLRWVGEETRLESMS